MKRFLVLTLVLTMIFPAYCFASPQKGLPIEDEIMEELMWIMEDGVVDEAEIEDLIQFASEEMIISPNQDEPDTFECTIVMIAIFATMFSLISPGSTTATFAFNIILLSRFLNSYLQQCL